MGLHAVLVAVHLAGEPTWLLLDEPSEGIDARTESRLVATLDAGLREARTELLLACVGRYSSPPWRSQPALATLIFKAQRYRQNGVITSLWARQ